MAHFVVTNNLQKDIEIQEISDVYKLSVWHFVPNLNYDFINNNYYLTISSSGFVSNMLSKRQERKKIQAINRRYEAKVKSAEIELKGLIQSVNDKFENLKASGLILDNDIEIFRIKIQQHQNNEIDVESFLKEKSAILGKIRTHNNLLAEIRQLLLSIERLTQTELNIDLSKFSVPLTTIDHD